MSIKQTLKQQLTKNYFGGLVDKPLDGSEFSLEQLGAGAIGKAPVKDFIIPNDPPVEDQGNTDFCVSMETSYTIGQDTGLDLSAPFNFAAAKHLFYRDNYLGFGLGIKDGLSAAQKLGICLEKLWPMYQPNGSQYSRNYLANWKNIPEEAINDAATRKLDKGFFVVDVFKDKFDNFLAGCWNWQELVLTGIDWYSGFYLDSKGRLITNEVGDKCGHCIGVKGSRIIDGIQYAVFKNSYKNIPEFCLTREQCKRLYQGYIALPISRPITELLLKYSSKIVKGSQSYIYLIQNGKKRWFPNENMLNLFGIRVSEYIEIDDSDLASIPEGEKMNDSDLKPALIDLVRRNNLKIS